MDWKAPVPYILCGPAPDVESEDVRALIKVAADRKMYVTLAQGLVMRIRAAPEEWYISFYVTNDNQHRFYEMSGEGLVYGKHEFPDLLAYLATQGIGPVMRPAAPLPDLVGR